MIWRIEFRKDAEKELDRLDPQISRRILHFLTSRLQVSENPRTLGKPLTGPRLGDYWRYRVGDYRLICAIQDEIVTIVVVEIGDRKDVYR